MDGREGGDAFARDSALPAPASVLAKEADEKEMPFLPRSNRRLHALERKTLS